MSCIIALVGVRGAGKSTLLRSLNGHLFAYPLQPTTNRPKRNNQEEYEFVKNFPRSEAMAWQIKVGEYSYGVRKRLVNEIPYGKCGVTVFDPGSLEVLNNFRQEWPGEVVTIGLDTIWTLDEQHTRVGGEVSREMSPADFNSQIGVVRRADLVLRGDATTVLNATKAVCALLASRGGLIGKNWLVPLIEAGALLDNARVAEVQPASYDLRLGSEIWCQGMRHDLSEQAPFFKIPPYSYAIVKAAETAKIPCFMAGRFDLTVSLFFKGVLLSNGPQVDPGYHGALFCMLFNGRDAPAELKMGEHFATLEFCALGSRIDGYVGRHQDKALLNQFLAAETGAGPGGNIVGRIENLEKVGWTQWGVAVGLLATILALPVAFQLWAMSEFKERENESLNKFEERAEKELQAVLRDLPQKTAEADAILSIEANKIARIRSEIDALKQQVDLQEAELKHTKQRRYQIDEDAINDLNQSNSSVRADTE